MMIDKSRDHLDSEFNRLPKAPVSIHTLYFKWSFIAALIITYKYTHYSLHSKPFCSLSVQCSRPEREVERTRSYFHKDSMPLTLNVLKMAPLRSGLASWVQIRYCSIGLGTPIRPAALFISNTITQGYISVSSNLNWDITPPLTRCTKAFVPVSTRRRLFYCGPWISINLCRSIITLTLNYMNNHGPRIS